MANNLANDRRWRGPAVVLAGGLIAAVLGAEAGAALRLQAGERSAPPPPQLYVMPDQELVALEQQHAGWPGRRPS